MINNTIVTTITGSGSAGAEPRTITFDFSDDIATFNEGDIVVKNGTLVASSLTKVSNTQYTIQVNADLAEGRANITGSIASGKVIGTGGEGNLAGKNTTTLNNLSATTNFPSADITNWDTSHATFSF